MAGLTDPVITTPINYYMRPALPHPIDYTGLGNGSCKFSTTLTQKDGSPLDTAVFTYTPENIQMDPANNNLWITHGSPKLVINTTDIAKDATVSLRLTLNSLVTVKVYDFDVILIDNPCVPGLKPTLTDNTYNFEYILE